MKEVDLQDFYSACCVQRHFERSVRGRLRAFCSVLVLMPPSRPGDVIDLEDGADHAAASEVYCTPPPKPSFKSPVGGKDSVSRELAMRSMDSQSTMMESQERDAESPYSWPKSMNLHPATLSSANLSVMTQATPSRAASMASLEHLADVPGASGESPTVAGIGGSTKLELEVGEGRVTKKAKGLPNPDRPQVTARKSAQPTKTEPTPAAPSPAPTCYYSPKAAPHPPPPPPPQQIKQQPTLPPPPKAHVAMPAVPPPSLVAKASSAAPMPKTIQGVKAEAKVVPTAKPSPRPVVTPARVGAVRDSKVDETSSQTTIVPRIPEPPAAAKQLDATQTCDDSRTHGTPAAGVNVKAEQADSIPPPAPTPHTQLFAHQAAPQAKAAAPSPPAQAPAAQAPAPPVVGKATLPPAQPKASAPQQLDRLDQQFQVSNSGESIDPTTGQERQKHYAAFKRQVQGEISTVSVPQEFVDAWQSAVTSKSRSAKNKLFQLWCSAGGSFSKITVSQSRARIDREKGKKKMGWRTRDQIVQMFNGNTHLADSLVLRKKSTGEFREHPDMPDDAAMTMYYVLVEMSHSHEDVYEDTTVIHTEGALDAGSEAAGALLTDNVLGGMSSDVSNLPRLSQPSVPAQGNVPAPIPGQPGRGKGKGTAPGTRKRKEMPDEPFAAAEWLLPKLLTDLSLSKTIPLKLSHMQHQQALCQTMSNHSSELEQSYSQLKAMIRQGKDVVLMDQLAAATKLALDRQSMFYEDKLAADGLCRTKKEKRKKEGGDDDGQ